MKPIEFLNDPDSHNTPHGDVMKVITKKKLIISDGSWQYKVLSYYYTPEGMRLDIEKSREED